MSSKPDKDNKDLLSTENQEQKIKKIATKPRVFIYERRDDTGEILQQAFISSGFDAEVSSNIDGIPFEKFDIFATEIETSDQIIGKIEKINPRIKIIIFSNFSRDKYIEELYQKGIELMLQKSYKLRDLICMAKMAVREDPEEIFGLDKYLKQTDDLRIVKKLDLQLGKSKFKDFNIGNEVYNEINSFIEENGLLDKIEDIDMLQYSIGELIDNSIEAQVKAKYDKIEVFIEYGFDKEKFGLTVYDKLGTLTSGAVVSGIGRQISNEQEKDKEYVNGTYFGPQGRGYFIIQYGVHRLSVIVLQPETAEKLKTNPRSDATLLVYFNKKIVDLESQIGPCGISMVVTL